MSGSLYTHCCRPVVCAKWIENGVLLQRTVTIRRGSINSRACGVRASMVDSYESSSNFVKRMELAWLISQDQFPIPPWRNLMRTTALAQCYLERGSLRYVIRVRKRGTLFYTQPRPVACSSCESKGHVECKWCGGTGFFILGDNMLCQVPSRNTHCVICAGKGSTCCSNCKGTGFRAKWLEEPPISK